jgi:hypothetical protein
MQLKVFQHGIIGHKAMGGVGFAHQKDGTLASKVPT